MAEERINYHAIPMEEMAKVGWAFWQAKRKGLDYPINPRFVPWGYYRYTKKDQTTTPLAIWESNGQKFYRFGLGKFEPMGNAEAEAAFAYATFQYVEKYPISKADYAFWLENQAWPDPHGVAAAVEASKPARAKRAPKAQPEPEGQSRYDTGFDNGRDHPAAPAPAAAEIGHNSDGAAMETLTAEEAEKLIKIVIEAASKFTVINTQAEADASKVLSDRLSELAKQADARREVIKRPHLEAERAVDAAWNPVVIKPAREAAKRLANLRGAFATAETARKKAEAAKAEAEAAALGVEAAPVDTAVVFTGAAGNKRKARTLRQATITDPEKLLNAIRNYDGIKDAMKEIANRVYYAGGNLPGCEERIEVLG